MIALLIFLTASLSVIGPIISALCGGGILGGLVTLLKSGAERESIVATATKSAIEVFESSINQLKTDLETESREADELRRELAEARLEIHTLIAQRGELETELILVRQRLRVLETAMTKDDS
jgi:septal ring factor EnvC (AmiA/AmiB activator)